VMNQLVAIEATFGNPVEKEPDFWDGV